VRTVDSISLDSLDGEAKAAICAMSDAMIVARSLEGRARGVCETRHVAGDRCRLGDTGPHRPPALSGLPERRAATKGCSRRRVFLMLPYSKRFNARPEIEASDAEL